MCLGSGVVVETGAVVEASFVGEGSVIEVGATIGRGSVIGKVSFFFCSDVRQQRGLGGWFIACWSLWLFFLFRFLFNSFLLAVIFCASYLLLYLYIFCGLYHRFFLAIQTLFLASPCSLVQQLTPISSFPGG